MPKTKKDKKPKKETPPGINGPVPGSPEEVMTLAEAAALLRASESDVMASIVGQGLPGRLVGDQWKFSKAAIMNWLSTSPPIPTKEAFLSTFGSLKDDPYLDEMLREIYEQRGRPMNEGAE